MTDRPIIFSAPMVNAILSGRKSMTRRILKPQPKMLNGGFPLNNGRGSYSTDAGWTRYSYAVGDRLWVREAFITGFDIDDVTRAEHNRLHNAQRRRCPVTGRLLDGRTWDQMPGDNHE